ncbi:TPA: guanine permease [Candidatus Sumerlaeota bacterium]|nr:guanine permease [Candidatus Sumerlaeota bacterium]
MLERLFKIQQHQTTVSREIVGGVVTFMAMAYVIFVNPGILTDAMDKQFFPALTVATCIAAGVTSIMMGLFANYPLALAPGMGLNATIAYTVIIGMHQTWQVAMGMVVIEGIIITLLVLTNVREWVMDAIPMDLKRGIGVGIGLFIALIGLKNAKIIVANPATILAFGKVGAENLIALFGLIITAILMAKRVRGAILIGILAATVAALFAGLATMPKVWVSGLKPEYFHTFFACDLKGALNWGLGMTLFAFLLMDFFDTMGSVVAVGEEGGFMDKDGKIPRLKRILLVDSLAAIIGGLCGCSSATTYVESATGVGEGGRTGLTSVVTGLLFLLAIFFAPVVGIVPGCATAPALIVVGYLMLTEVRKVNWDDFTAAFPAFLTMIMIPFTYSISNGMGYGFISYVFMKIFTGKAKEVHLLMYIVATLFGVYMWFA